MSWDDKDWLNITFWGENEEIVNNAVIEYDGIERKYDNSLNCISITQYTWNLYPLSDTDLNILQNISNKYSIKITYTFNRLYTVFKPQSFDL